MISGEVRVSRETWRKASGRGGVSGTVSVASQTSQMSVADATSCSVQAVEGWPLGPVRVVR